MWLDAKAAETRHLLPALAVLSAKWNAGSPEHDKRQRAAEALLRFYKTVYQHGWHLPPSAVTKCDAALTEFSLLYGELAEAAIAAGLLTHTVAQKGHDLCHFKQQLKFLNPRFCWTYKMEAFMSILIRLFKSCQHGTSSHKLNLAAMQKYIRLLHLALEGILSEHQDFDDDPSFEEEDLPW